MMQLETFQCLSQMKFWRIAIEKNIVEIRMVWKMHIRNLDLDAEFLSHQGWTRQNPESSGKLYFGFPNLDQPENMNPTEIGSVLCHILAQDWQVRSGPYQLLT